MEECRISRYVDGYELGVWCLGVNGVTEAATFDSLAEACAGRREEPVWRELSIESYRRPNGLAGLPEA